MSCNIFSKNNPFPVQVEKLQVRLDKAYTEKDKLEAKLENSQSELGKSKAELDKMHGDSRYANHDKFSSCNNSKNLNLPLFSFRYNDYNDWRQKFNKAELEIDRLRRVFCPFPDDFAFVPRNLSIYFPLESGEKY